MNLRKVIGTVCIAFLLASGCSSAGSVANTSDWQTGKDVLDALKSAGFSCPWTGTGEQVVNIDPMTGNDAKLPTVRCDGYAVALIESKEALLASMKQGSDSCRDLTQAEASDPQSQMQLVLGDSFLVAPNGSFPGEAQAQDFVKAFGGEAITLLDIYKMLCPDASVPSPNATAARPTTAAVDEQLTRAATALETFYTQNGAYPPTLTASGYLDAPGIAVTLTMNSDGMSYCLVGDDNSGSKRYYNSAAGGLTDTAC